MQVPKTLPRPSNWQDFEFLCKNLWAEVWKYPETKKNGRNGDDQQGVDVIGVSRECNGYVGIQCKGKDEYTNKQFSKGEIDREIKKALNFKPALKKFYLATTAVKSTIIEEYVRIKNTDHISKGLFEIHIFCWEDIVELLEEHPSIRDWYLNNQGHKVSYDVDVSFEDLQKEFTIYPVFKRTDTIFIPQEFVQDSIFDKLNNNMGLGRILMPQSTLSSTETNHSYQPIIFIINNVGDHPIENYKLLFDFDDNIQSISDSNTKEHGIIFGSPALTDIHISDQDNSGSVISRKTILVSEDKYTSDEIFVKPYSNATEVTVNWKFLSKTFKKSGSLKLLIEPKIKKTRVVKYVTEKSDEKIILGEVEDYIKTKNS